MSGNIRRRGKRSWQIQVEVGQDPGSGTRRRRYFSVKGTRRDAERALTDALHQRDTGIDLEPARLTVAEYFERWLRDYAQHNVAESTFELYAGVIRRHLVPNLGAVRLPELRPAHIQAAYGRSLESGLSGRTVLQHHRLLREALGHAVRWQLIARNPADAVTAPRPERTEMRVLDEEGVRSLLRAAQGTELEALLHVALATGARQGELLGLRWADVDLDQLELRIVRTARYFAGRGVVMAAPKTHRSRRPIALSTSTQRVLNEHRAAQNTRRLKLGEAWANHGLVFPSSVGTPTYARNLSRAYKRIVAKAGLDGIRFHDLRHTAATLMLIAGVHPKVVSERLGHSTVSITLDTYSHVLPDMQHEAAAVLDDVLSAGA